MRAARYLGPGSLQIEDLETPRIGEDQVLLRMRACGVCGTDVKTYLRGHPLIQPGSVLGHEVAGEVVESAHPRFQAGDRVAVAPYVPCGECRTCVRGNPSLCTNRGGAFLQPGGFAEYLLVPKRLADVGMYKVPDGMPYELASLAEPLACCVHGLKALDTQPGGSLLIIGDGPMGLMQAALARSFGFDHVSLAGVTTHRLDFARTLADEAIDVSNEDAAAAVRRRNPEGVDAVLVSVASLEALEQAMKAVANGGTINLFAGMPKDAEFAFDLKRIHYDEVRVVGTFGFGLDDFAQAIDLIGEAGPQLQALVTERVGLEGVEAALQAAGRQVGIKTVVVG